MFIQNNWALQHDQQQFTSKLKNTTKRLPRILRGKAYTAINATEANPTRANNRKARLMVQQRAERVSNQAGVYLAGFKVPAKTISSKEATRKFAADMAMACYEDMIAAADSSPEQWTYKEKVEYVYETAGRLSLERIAQVTPPFWGAEDVPTEVLECCLLRLQSEKWWARKLSRLRKEHLEYLEIIAGHVGRFASPYASKRAVSEFIRDKAAQRRWAESLILVNEQGDELDLIKAMDASTANPENARAELMKRIRGLEEYSDELGWGAVFLTLTAPSRMHPSSKKWDGSSPKQTNQYMVDTWSKARSALTRRELEYFGVRVSEPHKDGAPHWHVLLFMPKANIKKLCRVVRGYFCSPDIDELMERFKNRHQLKKTWKNSRKIWGLKKKTGQKTSEPRRFYMPFQPRFDAEIIDTEKGSAAAYIAKYISKNINGFEVSDLIDKETGKTIGQGVVNVKTWASNWNIRQFQFQGCDPITVYREIRRVREAFQDENQQELEALRLAAESNDFVDFIRAMKEIPSKLKYEVVPYGNEYGEAIKKLKGVITQSAEVITRAQKWELKRRADLKVGDSQQSWTCGTNCTQLEPTIKPDENALKSGFTAEAMALLRRGYTVNLSGDKYRIRYGAISQVGFDDKQPKHPPSKPLPTPQQKVIPLWH